MTVWDRYNSEIKRCKRKRIITASAIILIVLVLTVVISASLFIPSVGRNSIIFADTKVVGTEISAAVAKGNHIHLTSDSSSGVQKSPSSDTDLAPYSTAIDLITAEQLSSFYDLVVAEPLPNFTGRTANESVGPTYLNFTSPDGQEHEFSVTRATFVPTSINGAAGEWRVRPWWNPGWLTNSVDCGEPGTTVIAGHVSWYDNPGPFYELAHLKPGDRITCGNARGEIFRYEVVARWAAEYNDTFSYSLPPQAGEPESVLSLYSCTREITGISVIRAVLTDKKT